MLTQSFPLWGKRDLRREAALADVDAARGRERAAQDDIDERIKVAYAQYYLISRDIAVNREIAVLARHMAVLLMPCAYPRSPPATGSTLPVM